MSSRKATTAIAAVLLSISSISVISSPATANPSSCTITGTSRADVLTGTSRADVICGLGGNDRILGLGGSDTLYGGAGNDTIVGGDGNDYVDGGAGNDSIEGSRQDDDLFGGTGNDRIIAGIGDDEVSAGAGNDFIDAGAGADTVNGEDGSDSIAGGEGRDLLKGGNSSDNIRGELGDDLIDGGKSRDTISTGDGNDNCTRDQRDIFSDPCVFDQLTPAFGPMTMQVLKFKAGEKLDIAWTLSDASGVQITWAYLGGAPGWITNWCPEFFSLTGQRTSGDEFEGTYSLDCTIPQNAVNGYYQLFISASDLLGNATIVQTVVAFEVEGGSSDNRVPEVISVTTPETGVAGETFDIIISASDETGVDGIHAWLAGGVYGFFDGALFANPSGPAVLVEGDKNKGIFKQQFTLRDQLPNGSYAVWLSIRDELGNKDFFPTGKEIVVGPKP